MINILPADTYIVINRTMLTENDRRLLTMLYQPIIVSNPVNLFLTLWMDLDKNEFMSIEENHHHLMTSTSLSINEIIAAREKLEAVGLLKTFYKEKEEENNYIYELFSPLNPSEFFSHPILNIVLFNSVGKKEYEKIVDYFRVPRITLTDYEDITKSFNEVFTSTPSTTFENNIQNIKTTNKLGLNTENIVDFELLISSLPKETISEKTFTKEIKKLINDLSLIYNLSIEEIKNIILTSLIYQNQPEYLRSSISKDSKRAKMIYTFETISPYNYLKYKNNGAKPTDRDLKIIENLRVDLELSPAVINVLIYYVLTVNNNKLNKNLIETIASQWKRLNIETAEDAMTQVLKESKKKTNKPKTYTKKVNDVPEWFDKKIEKEEITLEDENEMKDLLKDFK